jgi:RimJ/RimL family protein N-acetyltransferase
VGDQQSAQPRARHLGPAAVIRAHLKRTQHPDLHPLISPWAFGGRPVADTCGRMGAVTEIRTPRLLLRRWHGDDLAAMAEYNADPQVMRWIGDGSVRDVAQTEQDIERWEDEWDDEGFGLFAVELLGSGELAGFTGLSAPYFLPEVLPAVEIGWRLGRPFWGQGYASEAARAALEFALRDRGLDRLVSVSRVGNDASENVMRKLGMTLERETTHPLHHHRLHVHAIDLTRLAGRSASPR